MIARSSFYSSQEWRSQKNGYVVVDPIYNTQGRNNGIVIHSVPLADGVTLPGVEALAKADLNEANVLAFGKKLKLPHQKFPLASPWDWK